MVFAYLEHEVTHLHTEVPDDPDVLADYAGRGWHPAPRPFPVPFYPSPDGLGQMYLDPAEFEPADYVPPESAPTEDNPPKNAEEE